MSKKIYITPESSPHFKKFFQTLLDDGWTPTNGDEYLCQYGREFSLVKEYIGTRIGGGELNPTCKAIVHIIYDYTKYVTAVLGWDDIADVDYTKYEPEKSANELISKIKENLYQK